MEQKINVHIMDRAARKFEAQKPRSMKTISADELCEDVDFYISCHAKAGMEFNRHEERIVYNECLIITIRAYGFIWDIIDITVCDTTDTSSPLFFWRIISRGMKLILTKILNRAVVFRRGMRRCKPLPV